MEVLSIADNLISSIEFLPKINMPKLKNLDLGENHIVSTRSLSKVWLPMIEVIDLANNPLIHNQLNYRLWAPKLKQFKVSPLTYENYKLVWSDRVLWRVKMASRFQGEGKVQVSFSPTYLLIRIAKTFRQQNEHQMGAVMLTKYRQMLHHKPDYSITAK